MAGDEDDPGGPLPEGAESYSRAQKALLAAVVTVGLLIMAGVGVVVVTIVDRLGRLSDTPTASVKATAGFTMSSDSRLALPAGAVVEETTLDGTRLAVRYRAPSGNGIIIFDLATGKTLGMVTFGP
jgi:hypothetical protein